MPALIFPSRDALGLPRDAIVDRVRALGAVAVVRSQHPDRLVPAVEALLDGALGDRVLLGVGSVTDAETAERAIEAGARYVVSPVFKPSIMDAARDQGAAAMPGCFPPTEAQAAYEAGADVVKVFPAGVLGMPFFKADLAPLPHLRLMPTGGVTLANAGDWLRAGAVAVGVGSALWDDRAHAFPGPHDHHYIGRRRPPSAVAVAQLIEDVRTLRREMR